jgi:hypothetical protein
VDAPEAWLLPRWCFVRLLGVIDPYDDHPKLNFTDANKMDLVEYLKGI